MAFTVLAIKSLRTDFQTSTGIRTYAIPAWQSPGVAHPDLFMADTPWDDQDREALERWCAARGCHYRTHRTRITVSINPNA
jgi:hypothetical protein